jgi:hypothetical protein
VSGELTVSVSPPPAVGFDAVSGFGFRFTMNGSNFAIRL